MPIQDVEEYLEAILDIVKEKGVAKTNDLARRLGVSPSSVTEVIQRLSRNDLINYEPYKGATLTDKGLKIAIMIKRKHRILEVFLNDFLHINPKNVHEDACKMEHCVSDEITDDICRLLGGPEKCPCGEEIPKCFPEKKCPECKRRK
jgi:DtxR family Mn-dependent transcriptional regulator